MVLTAICNWQPFALILGKLRNWFVTETLQVMQLTAILITVFCLTVSAKTVSQTITFSGKNVELKKSSRWFANKQVLYVSCDKKLATKADRINVSAKDMPLEELLKIALASEDLTYSILNTRSQVRRRGE